MKRNIEDITFKIWHIALRSIILPIGDIVFGQKMIERLKFLEKAQWWDKERIYEERDKALRKLIQIAYNEVTFYKDLFDNSNLAPDDIQTADDLSKLPIVTKDMLRAYYPDGTVRNTGRKTHIVSTSGSTGKNFNVVEDIPTMGWYRASNLLAMEWAGWNIGEPHLQMGMTLNRTFDRKIKDILFRCYYVSAYDLTDNKLDESLAIIEKHKLKHIWGYPGGLYYLAKRALKVGWNIPMKSVVTWGDNLYVNYRKTIESAFKVRVTDTYGCSEGMQIAAQCEKGLYHHHNLDVIVNFVDDEGNPVDEGQPGNMILTRLYPGPMPLIRYKVGDIGVSGKSKKCDCGRGFDILDEIQGRDTDIILTPSGNRLIVHFFTGILENFSEIELFQVVQDKLDYFTIHVVPRESFSKETERKIINLMRQKGGDDLDIRFEIEKDIPLTSSGKRRFVINNINNKFNF